MNPVDEKSHDRDTFLASFGALMMETQRVVECARDEAQRWNQPMVGTEHLLLALMHNGASTVAEILTRLDVDVDQVRQLVEQRIGRAERALTGAIGLTPRAMAVITLASEEARRLRHAEIAPEHLLLGLIREGEGIAAHVLTQLGMTLRNVRSAVAQVYRGATMDGSTARSNVVMCRIDASDLSAIDALVETGIQATRSEAAAWLIHAGVEANVDLFKGLSETVAEIRRLRDAARNRAEQIIRGSAPLDDPSVEGTDNLL